MHRDTHIVDYVNNIFDLLGLDDVIRQVIIDLSVGQVALLLAEGDQIFELLCLLVAANYGGFGAQDGQSLILITETSNCTILTESNLEVRLSVKGARIRRKQAVCGALTLKQRWADGIGIGSENASAIHTDSRDKARMHHRQVMSYYFSKAKDATVNVLKRSDLNLYFKVAKHTGALLSYVR